MGNAKHIKYAEIRLYFKLNVLCEIVLSDGAAKINEKWLDAAKTNTLATEEYKLQDNVLKCIIC